MPPNRNVSIAERTANLLYTPSASSQYVVVLQYHCVGVHFMVQSVHLIGNVTVAEFIHM